LRAGIEKETEGAILVSTRHSPRQFPLRPYSVSKNSQHLLTLRRQTPLLEPASSRLKAFDKPRAILTGKRAEAHLQPRAE
jgi:hypothetical protein